MRFSLTSADSDRDFSSLKRCLLIIAIAGFFFVSSTSSAKADGCWGSSRGGWGSGGSWGSGGCYGGGSYGCRGGLFANQPVRTLISRVGVGLGRGIAGVGNGIANVFERRPLRGGLFGSRGGWGCGGGSRGYGSSGGWSCTGGSTGFGSTGGWGCSGGIAAAPVSPVYSGLPVADGTAAAPLVADNSFQGFADQNYGCTGSVSAYVNPGSVYANSFETSAPILDYGYVGSQTGIIGAPTDAVIIDGSIVAPPVLDPPTVAPDENGGGQDSGGDDVGAQGENETTYQFKRRGSAVLTLDVPIDSKVFINDKLTTTKGSSRSYASRNLVLGKEYRYRVKVISDVDGKSVEKSRVVTMRGGEDHTVAFNFDPVVTRLLVHVPEDAKVVIDGKETTTDGTSRSFSTDKLTSGKWKDYSVEVSVVRAGKTLTRRENFDLVAGEFKVLDFDFDETQTESELALRSF